MYSIEAYLASRHRAMGTEMRTPSPRVYVEVLAQLTDASATICVYDMFDYRWFVAATLQEQGGPGVTFSTVEARMKVANPRYPGGVC